ncbi:MAG: hypothetical protein ABFR90_03480 [Planctomycetota bacterium]
MRKSGLHKQMSSVFDGVPVSRDNELPEDADASSVPMQPQAQPDPVLASEQTGSSLAKRMSADPSECVSEPAIQASRPMPLPKSSIAPVKTGPSLTSQIRRTVFGSHALDAHQKKMATLVGVLCIVFAVVLFVSLGGVGKSQAMAAQNTTENQTALAQGTQKTVRDWKNPQPLPAGLRDAMITVSGQTVPAQNSSQNASQGSSFGTLVVKGIVFSQNKPSAIINNQILSEGESIDGIMIVKITKTGVEFEADEKRWTQSVQR